MRYHSNKCLVSLALAMGLSITNISVLSAQSNVRIADRVTLTADTFAAHRLPQESIANIQGSVKAQAQRCSSAQSPVILEANTSHGMPSTAAQRLIANTEIPALHAAGTVAKAAGNAIVSYTHTTRPTTLCHNGGLSITKTRDLFFGSVVTGSKSGTVTTSPLGSGVCTGSVILEPDNEVGAAHFVCSFEQSSSKGNDDEWTNSEAQEAPLTVILPSSIILKRTDGAETMTVDQFKYSVDHNDIYVGATLHINANQLRGSYTGQFLLMVIAN